MSTTLKVKSERNVRFEDTSPEFNVAWQHALQRFDLGEEEGHATLENKFVHAPLPIPKAIQQKRRLCHPRRGLLDVGRFVLLDCDKPTEMEIDSLKDKFVRVFIAHHEPLKLQANKKLKLEEPTENGALPCAYLLPAKKPNALQRFLNAVGVWHWQPLQFTIGAPREVPAFYRQFQEQPHYEVKVVRPQPLYSDPDLIMARYADGRLFYGGNIDLFVVRPTSTVRLFLYR